MYRFALLGLLPMVPLVGCGQGPPELAMVCPQPGLPTTDVPADANADGAADIADAVVTARAITAGGPLPACADAVRFRFGPLAEARELELEMPDALNVLHYLFTGQGEPRPGVTCTDLPASTEACARVGFELSGPSSADGAAEVVLGVVNQDLAPGVHAWSAGLSAEGCTIAEIDVEDTVAAPMRPTGPGLVTEGYVQARADGATASTAVVPSWLNPVALPPADASAAVARLTVEPEGPGCQPCTLTTGAPVAGPGQPVETVLASDTASYRPAPVSHTLTLCAP